MLLMMLLPALLVAGCADSSDSGSSPGDAQPVALEAQEGVVAEGVQDVAENLEEEAEQAAAEEEAGADGAEDDASEDAESAEAAAQPPDFDPTADYTATDPGTVALGQGTPQLLKFYADW